MSGTCIVCLGDLGESCSEIPALASALAKSPVEGGADQSLPIASSGHPTSHHDNKAEDDSNDDPPALIAHLQPCGHNLHNDCLTPWVERANSCPICRQSFHSVQLSETVGGDVISSYAVEDKTQVAELDPSVFLEIPDDDLDDQPCQVCGEDDNEDVLMYCDRCQKLWHTYCVDLQEVPRGHWFCDHCRALQHPTARRAQSDAHNRAAHRPSTRRTRGQQRRYRTQHQATDSSWTRVWQSVWDRINLDLDFPYDDEESAATYIRRHRQRNEANRREHEAWQRRMQVAELHGAGGRFRETESTLLDRRAGASTANGHASDQPHAPAEESPEELLAWHAFDQAVAAESGPSTLRKRKRKSAPSSPVEPVAPASARPLKKARPSQIQVKAESSSSATAPTRTRRSPRPSPPPRRPQQITTAAGPSFLQSLLKEVEDSTVPNHGTRLFRPSTGIGQSPPAEQYSPQPSSPALSPLPSNHSSPRAMSATPPPPSHLHGRPNSPTGLSSSIQPVYPLTEGPVSRLSPEPPNPPSEATGISVNTTRVPIKIAQPTPQSRMSRALQQTSPPPSRPRSNEGSPARPALSFNAKSDVQKMVSAALKPFYNDRVIDKDEYTSVNRDTCHKLYDKIGDFEALDVEGRARWEKIAGEEVTRAVGALRAPAGIVSDS